MKQGRWAIASVSIILGIMFVLQIRMTREVSENNLSMQRAADLAIKLEEAEKKRDALQEELYKLQQDESRSSIKVENQRLRYEAGLTPVKGRGVIVTIEDSKMNVKVGENPNLYLIHDEDILKIVNELKAAGAEAISINEQRLVARSEIRCVGPTITINRKSFASPYIIKAIGKPDTLAGALQLRGGVAESLKVWGIDLNIKKEENIVVPGYDGSFIADYGEDASKGGN